MTAPIPRSINPGSIPSNRIVSNTDPFSPTVVGITPSRGSTDELLTASGCPPFRVVMTPPHGNARGSLMPPLRLFPGLRGQFSKLNGADRSCRPATRSGDACEASAQISSGADTSRNRSANRETVCVTGHGGSASRGAPGLKRTMRGCVKLCAKPSSSPESGVSRRNAARRRFQKRNRDTTIESLDDARPPSGSKRIEQLVDSLPQRGDRERLADQRRRGVLQNCFGQCAGGVAGHEQNRKVRPPLACPAGQLDA